VKYSKLGGFDSLAATYDMMARLAFGNSIRNAQLCYLEEVGRASRVLVLGGGTGWLLGELLRISSACEVWYIDASLKMLQRAKRIARHHPGSIVHFIHGTEESIPFNVQYDVVITNFYFDMFSHDLLRKALGQINRSIAPGTKLLASDFVENNVWWQSFLLFTMYQFFRRVCKIEAHRLPDWEACLRINNFECKESRFFYGKFIKSSVFQFRGH